uniref:DNA repair protein RadA n=1 Tax=Anthurium amnicola TaxID=1678845 RepID=A0A1D1ZBV1_9ARAE
MELQQESSKSGALPATTTRNVSSSSSAFVSASQSPFFSPRSPASHGSELLQPNNPSSSLAGSLRAESDDILGSNFVVQESYSLSRIRHDTCAASPVASICTSYFEDSKQDLEFAAKLSPSNGIYTGSSSNHSQGINNGYLEYRVKQKRAGKQHGRNFAQPSTLLSSTNRQGSSDVYLGFHGRKPSLLRFANWLRAELEIQGISCFAVDRARCRNGRSHDMVERAMNAATFGVVILTKKSFGNPHTIQEIRNFLGRKNLVPVFFDLGASDCLARDIVERRGDIWERHGGELWMLYGGVEKEWKDAVHGLARVENLKLEANDGNWRDCILRSVILLATRLGRRSAVERVNRWREKVDKEEFPFPRNENFIGRKKELSELELILFGDVSGDGQKDYFELKTRRRQKNLVIGRVENSRTEESAKDHRSDSSSKGKEPVVWKESEREIELQRMERTQRHFHTLKLKSAGRHGRRRRSMKIMYGKGIACVSGDPGIGKTELLLEYAYKFCQRYKMVLWIGGESRYIRQNYLNLKSFLEVDVGIENHSLEKGKAKCFEELEEESIARVRKELMRDIPYLVIIDNLEHEKDWWDQKSIMDLLPRFGGVTHIIISTHLPRVMNLEPIKLTYLSGVEAMALMKGTFRDYPVMEVDALKVIEERLGRLTLGLSIVGAILSELPISPSRLLDTINRMPMRDFPSRDRDAFIPKRHSFLRQLLDVCFSIFEHADGPQSLATRMVQASGWFAPAAIPIALLALAAHKVPKKHRGIHFWKRCMGSLTCSLTTSHIKKSEVEASSMLIRFGVARSNTKPDCIHFHDIVKLHARKRGAPRLAQAMLQAVSLRGTISQHPEHLWAACFLLFGFGTDPVVLEPEPSELISLVKRVVLPLAIHTFITFSRCNAALELLRLCTDALEIAAESLISRAEKWFDKSLCCMKPIHSNAHSTYLWQELALLRASVMETRAKLMLRGGQYDVADDLIRKAIFIRTSICGEHHPDTASARETLSKLTRLLTNVYGS